MPGWAECLKNNKRSRFEAMSDQLTDALMECLGFGLPKLDLELVRKFTGTLLHLEYGDVELAC